MQPRLTLDSGLPVAEMQRIDEACDRFEAAWRGGDRPDLRTFLAELEGVARARLLRELLELELEFLSEAGEMPDPRRYRERLPEHVDIVDAVFARRTHTGAPRDHLDRPSPADVTIDLPPADEAHAGVMVDVDASTDPSTAVAPPPSAPARIIAGYEIQGELGRGGMGVVYKARQIALGRMVALKLIRSAEFATTDELVRFPNEAEAVARLDHPHIVPIFEVGQWRALRFFSMKLIEGSSLDRKLATYTADFAAAARLAALVAEGVHHAHQRGILHRDLKPANILLDDRGTPHITDFGLARRIDSGSDLTQSGLPMGTPSYMSPEQARGDKGSLTTATDVYGLGSILYALLTGRAPFAGTSLAETLDMVRAEPAPAPSRLNGRVPRDLEVICLKCLEKDPERRYKSALDLADDLNRWLSGEPIRARPVGPATRAVMWCRRHPLPATLSGMLAIAVLGGLAGVTWKWREAAAARDEAKTINDFLVHKLLDQSSPRYNPRGASLTAGELLDLTTATLGGEFEGRPAVEATIRRTLGSAYQGLGLYENAEPHFRKAIELDSRTQGKTDRQTLRDANLLTGLLDEAGRYDEAEGLLRRQLVDCTGALGPGDRITLEAEYQLGVLLGHLQKTDEAESVLRRCVEGQRKALGSQDEQTLRSINRLGLLLQDVGKLDEAYRLADEYERGVKCLWGTKHPDNGTAKASLARVRQSQGQLEVAELLYEGAAAEAERIFGPEHPRTFIARSEYASILRKNGKSSDAARLLEGTWDVARTGRGLDDPETLKAGCRLALFLIVEKRTAEAERVILTVLPRSETRLGPEHPITREARRLSALVKSAEKTGAGNAAGG
jgi:tetratricopeptide (TPR) repeat protein